MFHLAAFTGTFAAALTDGRINALADDVLQIRSNDFWLSQRLAIPFAVAMGPTLDDARLETPSLRLPSFPYVDVNESATPPSPLNLTDWRVRPFQLQPNEQLRLSATDPAAAPGRVTGLVGLTPGLQAAPPGNIFRLQGTSTDAATANTWTTLTTVTYTNNLPDGRYALVGMEHFSANGQAARVIFISPGNQILRPGCVSKTALGGLTHMIFRMGNLGLWGVFESDDIPNIQVLCNAADAVHTIYLDLVKIG